MIGVAQDQGLSIGGKAQLVAGPLHGWPHRNQRVANIPHLYAGGGILKLKGSRRVGQAAAVPKMKLGAFHPQ